MNEEALDTANTALYAQPNTMPALSNAAFQSVESVAPFVAVGSAVALIVVALWTLYMGRTEKAPWEKDMRDGVVPEMPRNTAKYSWGLWPTLPLQPYGRKVTLETEVVKDTIWTHDQIQGTVNVVVPIRQTVIKLKGGGLWVHNPIAPTRELIDMMRRLEEKHGPVKHIVLGTLGIEHKFTAGPFSRKFRQAQVWVMPGQYSFPLNLPNLFLGFTGGKPRVLPEDPKDCPFSDEIDYIIFGPLQFQSVGGFGETGFFHKKTRTLLVTDAIVEVRDDPPAIVTEDPRALLFHARDAIDEEIVNSPQTRRKGWRRIAQFGLNFLPSALDVVPAVESITDLQKVPKSMKNLGGVPYGLTPWRWTRDDRPSFKALQGGLLVAPILRELIFNRFPEETLEWADKVSKWPFQRIIPCHLANDIKAGPQEFRAAFEFLEKSKSKSVFPVAGKKPGPLFEDGKLLRELNETLISSGVLPPPKVQSPTSATGRK
jgi:hypothetical protein